MLRLCLLLLSIFAATEAWRDECGPFWVLVNMHADGIAYLPDLA